MEFNAKYLNTLANENIGSPLCDACVNGQVEIIKFLIQAKANIHLCARFDHSTALHKAAESNSIDTVLLMLENKADINSKTSVIQKNWNFKYLFLQIIYFFFFNNERRIAHHSFMQSKKILLKL